MPLGTNEPRSDKAIQTGCQTNAEARQRPRKNKNGYQPASCKRIVAFNLNPAVEKRKWRRSPRCQGRQAGILEFGLDKFLKNPQQDEFPALWVGQLLRSSDQTL